MTFAKREASASLNTNNHANQDRPDNPTNLTIEQSATALEPPVSRISSNRTSEVSRAKDEDAIERSTSPDATSEDGNSSAGQVAVDVETGADTVALARDGPPEGGYGWVCVLCVAGINAHTWGMNSSYAVFLAHYLNTNTFPSASPLDFALIGGLSIGVSLLISPLSTYLLHTFGTRPTLLLGTSFLLLSFLASSFVRPGQLWPLFLSQGLCFGCGLGMLFVGSVGIVPQWFQRRRSLANGIATAGSGLGGLVYSFASQALIRQVGLAWCFRILGILTTVVNLVCSLLVRDRHAAVKSVMTPFEWRFFARYEYLLLTTFGVFSMLGYVVLLFSLPSHAASLGYTSAQGSILAAIMNLGQMLGRPPVGYFSDTVGRINMCAAMTATCGVFVLVWWIPATSFGALVAFALFGGSVAGTFWATIAPVTAEVVGLQELPAALSILWLVIGPPCIASEVIGLELVKSNGGRYRGAQLFSGFMYLGAALCMVFLRAWKIKEVRRLAREKDVPVDQISVVDMDSKSKEGYTTGLDKEIGVDGNMGDGRADSKRESVRERKTKRRDSFLGLIFTWTKV
ncbi:MFS general substrate transporter [Eremomyces bilateralis CBS 781.70]|uniref:MFS general substrate transporter n=1 Tax=Eremomyces bilateralis CBS 781.70 TaxID=1392243 RepID=A0A6G1GGD4_9PEZI|nr:MFS general substrate transporter [Eremomyces bilateralis CBS 781.70]KAF1817074.1 MFS general substrate transporter [Eremomyces bilateralis CBS 781.70]